MFRGAIVLYQTVIYEHRSQYSGNLFQNLLRTVFLVKLWASAGNNAIWYPQYKISFLKKKLSALCTNVTYFKEDK
jgi:hypothetical protein